VNARDAQPFDAIIEARRLLRRGGTAALATLTGDAPLTTLVAVASDFDGAPLMLLSTLSVHTRNLIADPRSSLLIATTSQRGDPLNQPRLTVLGRATPTPTGRARYLARHPKAKLYASFADFRLYRFAVESVHFNGGFARAAPMTPSQLLSDVAGADDLLAAEADLLERINAWPGLAALGAPASATWRAFALDPDGFDLRRGGAVTRANFLAPAKHPDAWFERARGLVDARNADRPT
jgi:putative heme iron utilization protein